jgi:hypothetical protein
MNKRGKDLAVLVIALCIYLGCIGFFNVIPAAKADDGDFAI